MKLKTLAIAAGALCAAAGASAQVVNAGGASATRATITNAVVESICGAASGTTVYRNGSNVTRIVCPTTVFGGASTLDFSYDNTTGSYLGIGPVAGNPGQTTARINLSTCSGTGTEVIGGKTVAVRSCTGNEATRVRPAIGNSDVEPELFVGANLPAGATAPVAGGIGDVRGQFGIIFGIVVSQALYQALQADQGLTVGSTTEANRPSLSTGQVLSLSTANGGPLNNDWTALFTGAPPAAAAGPVRWVRRVSGSGSQATFNANLLGYACTPRAPEPAAAQNTGTYIVEEHGSTGNQLTAVGSATEFRAGFASRENAETATWKFVKLDGVFPAKTNVQSGKYNWFTEQVLTLRSGATANDTTFFEALVTATGSPTVINGFAAAVREGVVALPGIADAGDPNYATHRTRFRTIGNNCAAPFAVE